MPAVDVEGGRMGWRARWDLMEVGDGGEAKDVFGLVRRATRAKDRAEEGLAGRGAPKDSNTGVPY